MAESETALLEQYVRTRDAIAFRELVEQHQDMVFAACHRVLGNRADAEDASQNCFLKLAQAAGRLQSPIAGWLHTVAVQGSIDILRSGIARRARERAVAVHPEQAAACESAWADVLGEVDAAIVALPERLRTPIVLYFLERRTQAEVAAELGLVRQSVTKRLRRGVEALRRRLKRAGIVAPAVALTAMLTTNAAEAAPATLTATLGKVALAGASGTQLGATTTGVSWVTLKTVTALALGAAAGAGAVVVHQATKPPHPMPLAAAAPMPPATPAPPTKKKAPLTPETALDAELTLVARRTRVYDLTKIIWDQCGIGVVLARWPMQCGGIIPDMKPGKYKLRDVLAKIDALESVTTEVLADRDGVVICFWRKPDAQILAEMMKLTRSDKVVERCTGARWLVKVGGRDALAQLLKMLSDPHGRVRHFAAKAITEGWSGCPRTSLVRGFGSDAPSRVVPEGTGLAVAKSLDIDKAPETREYMLSVAAGLRDPVVLPVLKRQLENLAEEKRAMTLKGEVVWRGFPARFGYQVVAYIGGPEAEAFLLAEADKLEEVRGGLVMSNQAYAARRLGTLGTDGGVAWLNKQIDIEAKKGKNARFDRIVYVLAGSDNPAAAHALIRILNWPDVSERDANIAARYLAKFDTPEARAACLKKFEAMTDPEEQFKLARAMLHIPTVRRALFAGLTRGGLVARRPAFALASTRDPRLVPVLARILVRDDGDMADDFARRAEKCQVAAMLGRIDAPEAGRVLVAVFKRNSKLRDKKGHTIYDVHRTVIRALGSSSFPAARRALRDALQDPDGAVRVVAAEALMRGATPADLDFMLAAARRDPGEEEQYWVVRSARAMWFAVAAVGDERAVGELVAEVAKGNTAAARALLSSNDMRCVMAVRDALAGDDVKLRETLLALSGNGHDWRGRAIAVSLSAYYGATALLAELPDADDERRAECARLLGRVRDPRGADVLVNLLGRAEEPAAIRRAATRALRGYYLHGGGPNIYHIADPAVVEPMRHAFEHDADEEVRKLAREALIRWGIIPPGPAKEPRRPKKRTPKNPPDERDFPPPPKP